VWNHYFSAFWKFVHFFILEINCLLWKIEIFSHFINVNNLETFQQKGKCLLQIIFTSNDLNFIYNSHSNEEQLKACDVNEKKWWKIFSSIFENKNTWLSRSHVLIISGMTTTNSSHIRYDFQISNQWRRQKFWTEGQMISY
jgi:hypothetical protein